MARIWWTLDPSKYYLKQVSTGGRNEIIFTTLAVAAGYAYFGKQRCETYWRRRVDSCAGWSRATTECGKAITLPAKL